MRQLEEEAYIYNELFDFKLKIQAILPDHNVQIHNNNKKLFIKDYDDTARDILKEHGYKYTIRFGCEYQLGKEEYGRKYHVPPEEAKRILLELKLSKEHAIDIDEQSRIIIWIPRCYDDTEAIKRVVKYYTGVREHDRHLADGRVITVKSYVRAVTERSENDDRRS